MAEISLITLTQARAWIDISPNFDDSGTTNRFDIFVNRVQKNNLRNLLGDAMYYALFQAVTDINTIAAPYANLVNGISYTYQNQTIQYYGLKPYISYLLGIMLLFEGDNYHTDYGNAMFTDNPQENLAATSFRVKKEIKSAYEQNVNFYKCEIIKFLTEHISTYTLWQQEWQPPDERNRIIRKTIYNG